MKRQTTEMKKIVVRGIVMHKRARVIYNPTSGRELIKKHLPDVLDILEGAGYEASAHATKGEDDATLAAKEAVERGFDIIVAAGGDGTLKEVITGVAPFEKRPKVGLIPTGTTNDFSRALHIPRDILEAAQVIADGHSKAIDVGQKNEDEYFINIAGGGHLTELTYDVPIKLKTMLGQLAYYLKGIEMLPSIHASHLRIEYDGKVYEEEAMMFLLALTNSVGGFEKISPDAELDDGYFTLMALKKCNIADFIRLATLAVRGEHLDDPLVFHTKAREVTVTSHDQVLLNLDGEYGGKVPATFRNLHQHIEFFVPKGMFSSDEA